MPVLSNRKHEQFCQELAKGTECGEAYAMAGYRPNDGNARTLRGKQALIKRVLEIRNELAEMSAVTCAKATEKAAEALSIDKEWIMSRLKENAERALQAVPVLEKGEPTGEYRYEGSVANRALELLGKELGMFIERREIGGPGDFERMSDGELEKFIVERQNALSDMIGGCPSDAIN